MIQKLLILPVTMLFLTSCSQKKTDKALLKNEIYQTEKAFETMCAQNGIAEAFAFFADSSAVIVRGHDSLISGKDGIRNYYLKKNYQNATVNWTPNFIDVSDDGTMGYTYGNYIWRIINEKSDTLVYKGIFHTIWKRQDDNSWKYVWD